MWKRLGRLSWPALAIVTVAGCDGIKARLGNARAQYELGKSYQEGRGVAQDLRAAAEWLDAACNRKHGAACASLGSMYDSGTGVIKDAAKAAQLYEAACAAGEAGACVALGRKLSAGDGVPQDAKQAQALFKKACDTGSAAGCVRAALTGSEGHDPATGTARTIPLFERACSEGEPIACRLLARTYYFGLGVAKDKGKASELYERATRAEPAAAATSGGGSLPDPETPVFLGPEGTGFWTTLRYAQFVLGGEPLPAAIKEFNGRILTGQDSMSNVYMMVEEAGRRSSSVQLTEGDTAYRQAEDGTWLRCFRTPVNGAPWIGVSQSGGFYLRASDKLLVKIGTSEVRSLGERWSHMARGVMEREPFLASEDGVVLKSVGERSEKAGDVARFWVTPGALKTFPIPVVMARRGPGAKWVGEYGGTLYVER